MPRLKNWTLLIEISQFCTLIGSTGHSNNLGNVSKRISPQNPSFFSFSAVLMYVCDVIMTSKKSCVINIRQINEGLI